MSITQDNFFVPLLLGACTCSLDSIHYSFAKEFTDVTARSLVKLLISQIRVQELEIHLHSAEPFQLFEVLQPNTVSSLDIVDVSYASLVLDVANIANGNFFSESLLASQSQVLTSLYFSNVFLQVKSVVLMPNLETLVLFRSRVEGWDNLCRSVPALKDMRMEDVNASGDMTSFTAIALLENLCVYTCRDLKVSGTQWFDAYSKSLVSLRRLRTDVISVDSLTTILKNNPDLEELCIGEDDLDVLTDKHLAVICRFARPSLRSLSLHGGHYSQRGLKRFIAKFPVSVKSLTLIYPGLNVSHIRSLLQLALREIQFMGPILRREDLEEIERMAVATNPDELELYVRSLRMSEHV